MVKSFILSDRNIDRNSYIYNMIGSLLVAFQSVILLMILTRVLGLVAAGIFTFAYANANLLLTVGRFGMRPFQASDVTNQFSFQEYRRSRWITSGMTLLLSGGFVIVSTLIHTYDFEKSMILLLMCIYKLADGIEDVYYGQYQQRGRLDIAGKALTIRLLSTIILFGGLLIFVGDLLWALLITTIFTYSILLLLLAWTHHLFTNVKRKIKNEKVFRLLKACFPLFLGGFLSFLIGNLPRYAIDASLTYEIQAIFGFIAMPVFVIGLLSGIIFNPMIQKMSQYWNQSDVKSFVKQATIQSIIVVGLTLLSLVGAYFLGVPILSLLYSTDLSAYRLELLILLLGGGFLGLSGLLHILITIIRRQAWILWSYGLVTVLALMITFPVVRKYGILGASLLYLINMVLLCICLFAILFIGIRNYRRNYC